MHENTKITLRQIVGAGKVKGRVVDEPREGPKMRTNLSILGWFIKSMSLSYHPTRVSWLFREIENTWSRTTVDWSLTVFLAFPPEGTLICSWASFFFVTAHKFPCFEVGHQQPGQERRGEGWRRSRRVHFHQEDIFLHLHNPPQTWEQTKSNSPRMAFLISPGLGEEVKEEVACNERKEGDENWEEDVHCAGNLLVRYLGHSSPLKHMERLSCQFQYRFQHGIF